MPEPAFLSFEMRRNNEIFGSRNIKKQNQLDQRGNTFWEPIELVERRYSSADSSSTDFFEIFGKSGACDNKNEQLIITRIFVP
jgi:hypothetical protein